MREYEDGFLAAFAQLEKLIEVGPDSSQRPLLTVKHLTATFSLLNSYWEQRSRSASAGSHFDFYSDGMLGYSSCEYISENEPDLKRSLSNQDSHHNLTRELITYSGLYKMLEVGGDLEKRIADALFYLAASCEPCLQLLKNAAHMYRVRLEDIASGEVEMEDVAQVGAHSTFLYGIVDEIRAYKIAEASS
jgi:hypothetical protein